MPPEAHRHHYKGNIGIGMPPGQAPQVSQLVVRRTHLYRIASLREATISRLEPDTEEIFLFASPSAPLSVQAGRATARVPPRCLVRVQEPRMKVLAEADADLILAVSPASFIHEMNLQVSEPTATIAQVKTSTLLGSLELALLRAFDAADAGGGYLDPRVIDVLHVMSRGILQLPADVETLGPGAVTSIERARALIAEMHSDPDTTPGTIACALGIPLRTLQRAFSAEHSSIARELRRARASAARALLASPTARRYSAKRIAREAGFGSVASMRRALVEFASVDEPDKRPP